jgi:hypothetical protein
VLRSKAVLLERTQGKKTTTISILHRRQAENKLAAKSDADVKTPPMPPLAGAVLLFGDRSCAIRPHEVCPVPVVEIDTSESDFFPVVPGPGDVGGMSVAVKSD